MYPNEAEKQAMAHTLCGPALGSAGSTSSTTTAWSAKGGRVTFVEKFGLPWMRARTTRQAGFGEAASAVTTLMARRGGRFSGENAVMRTMRTALASGNSSPA